MAKKYKDILEELQAISEENGMNISREQAQSIVNNAQQVDLPNLTTTKKRNNWINTGAFDNGYQPGDVIKTIVSTANDLENNVYQGAAGTVEGILDFGINTTSGLFNEKTAQKMRNFAQTNYSQMMFGSDEYEDTNSLLGTYLQGGAQGVGNLAAQAGLNAAGIPWQFTAFASSAGNEMNNAFGNNATYGQALTSGIISGLVETGSEYIGGGANKLLGMTSLGSKAIEKLGGKISNKVLANLTKFGLDVASEGLEEVISGVGTAIGQKLTYMNDKKLKELYSSEDALNDFIVGALTSAVANTGNVLPTQQNLKRNAFTGLTDNEQTILDKEIENRINEQEVDGKKLTQKEKDRVYDQVKKDLERGYVGTDTIENALGYNEIVNKMVTDTENAMGKNVTKEELADIQQEARERIQDAIKDDEYLQESYNEKARKSQNYTNDLSKYSETQQKTIQKAIDSGILNNTNRTHDFVDMIAKISEDKGVDFDFTNNEKLKNSNFSVNGDINGYVDNGTITLNTDSKKSLNSVVGHEITHVLEGTELYDSLKQAVKEYATAKGEYDTRLAKLNELYNGVKNADVENELTSDIIGDYLFTDEDFINTLSTKHRNIFQKIYDEIKYLIKTVTAGSNEERELLKVKKAFDKAYKQKPVQQQGVKYSLSPKGEMVDNEGNKVTLDASNTGNTKTLMAIHNLNEDKMKGILELGGFPVPSIAVTNPDLVDHKQFGDISVLFDKSTIDPAITANEVYDRDVWSPTFPQIDYELNDDAIDNVADNLGIESWRLRDAAEDNTKPEYLIERLLREEKLIDKYVNDNNIAYETAYKDAETKVDMHQRGDKIRQFIIDNDFDFRKLYKDKKLQQEYFDLIKDYYDNSTLPQAVKENLYNEKITQLNDYIDSQKGAGDLEPVRQLKRYQDDFDLIKSGENKVIDEWQTNKNKKDAAINNGIENYLKEQVSDIYGDKGIRNDREIFTPSGNRRSFWQLHDEYNLENIVDALTKGDTTGTQSWFAGYGQIQANMANRFNSINDIKANENKLTSLAEENDKLTEARDNIENDIDEIVAKNDTDMMVVSELLADFARGDLTVDNFKDLTRNYYQTTQNVSDKLINKIIKDMKALKDLPTDYFEAKPQRAVELDEIQQVVIPNNVDAEFKQQLQDMNIPYTEYDPSIEGDRNRVINQFDDLKFSLSNQETAPTGAYNVTGEDIRLQEQQEPVKQVSEKIDELVSKIDALQQEIQELGKPTQNADEQAITQQYSEAPMNEVAPLRENLTKDESEDLDMLEDYFNRYKENNDIKNDEELAIDIQFASDGDKQLYSMYKDLQEKESGYYEQETADDEIVSRGLDDRELGKRKVKAYQYEHPEVKPYFQQEATALLNELNESTFGERTFDSETYYNTDGEYGWNGTKRDTSDSLARFKDNNNYTWAEIRKGLEDIIEDNGEENNAVSKKLEVVIDDRLRNGYDNFGTEGVFLGKRTEPNQEYIRLLNEIQRQEALSEIPLAEEDTSENMDIFDPRSKAISEARKESNRYEIALALKNATGLEENLQNRVDEIKAKINDTRTPLETIVNNNLTKKLGTEPQHIEPRKKSSLRNFIDNAKRLFINENAEVDNIAREYKAPQLKYNFDMLNNAFAEGQNDIDVAQTDNYGKAIGKSVNQLFQPAIDSGLYDAFNDYLINYSNIDRHNQGKGSQTPLDVSENLVKAYEKSYPEFKEWAKDVWNYGKNTRDNMLEAGLIDEGLYNALGEMYPHYVPYISDVENINGLMQDVGEVKPRGLKKAYGKAGKVLPVQEALSKYTYSMKRGIRQNNAFNQLIDTLGTAEQGTDDRTDYTNLDSGLYRDRNGAFVTAYKDGNARSIRITDDLYKSLKNDLKTSVQNIEEQLSLITKPLQKLSNIRRNVLTSWSPTFPIKNALKDFQGALFNSKHTAKMLKNYPGAIKELSKMNTPEVRQFTALYGSGNLMGQFDEGSYKSLGKNKFLRGISKANEVIELAPRYAEFKASLESGASIEEAMYNAREVTTNFSRGGTITKALNRNGFTFLNSSVQGFDKFVRNFSGENGAKGVVNALLKAAMFGVVPALFNDLVFGSGDDKDEDYEALPDYIKDNYYLIKTGDNQFVRIPKGREFSVFGSAARRTLEALGGEEDAFNGYLKNAWEQIGVGDLEQNNIIAPLLQAYGSKEGTAWYGGDIIPTRLQDKPAEEQYDASTDKLSVWLGQQLGLSPYKLNYVIDQYTGGIGDIVLPLITPEATSEGSVFAPITDQFTSNSTMKNKYASDFYTKLDELKVKNNSVNASDEDSIMYKYMNSVSGEMSQLYKEKREIQESDLPKDEKFAKVQSIQEQINSLAKEGLENYKNYTVSNGYAEVNGTDYYKNDEGKWTKAKQDTSNTLNSYGLDTQEKSTYFNTQTEISNIKKSNEDYATKKSNVIDTIVNSNLTDDSKVLLYTENYKDEDINDLMEVGINVDSYLTYKGQNFTADKDSNGKSINGSKKNKVFDYINQMNIPFEEKCILAKLQYNSYDDYNNEIINYLNNNNNVDYETMNDLLKKMGFKVDANGNIKW